MKTINPNVYPKDGYRFRDSDGSLHVAQTWGGVIARVRRYRLRNNRPEGAVMEEVIAQACQNNPGLCSEEHPANKAAIKQASLKSRILIWLNRMHMHRQKEPLTYVNDPLHAARVDVCSRCPKQTGLPEGCGSCRAALRTLAESVIGSRAIDQRVTACSVLGEYLPVSTWIEQMTIPNPDLHWECWRKRSL